ncbi:MAG: CRISPR-associated endoribonuclease Cas6 [Candidatus Thermoplasmatota archaeon]
MHLTFQLNRIEGKDPPYDHNFLLGSALYRKLQEASEEAATAAHDSPYRSPYVLSEIHRVRGKPREAWFRMGTTHESLVRAIGKALAPGTNVQVGPTLFQVTGILMEEPVARPGEYVTLSPILLRDEENGQSIVHDTPGTDYKQILEDAVNTQVKNYLKKEGTVKVIHFEPQAVRKRRIKDRTVLAQKGRMLLDGEEEQLRLLVNHGIGSSPALGFGMVVLNRAKAGLGVWKGDAND